MMTPNMPSIDKGDFQIESVESQANNGQQNVIQTSTTALAPIGDLSSLSLLKSAADEQGLALGLYCYQCTTQYSDQFAFIEHLKSNELCKKMIRNVGLNYCFVCKKTYESVRFQKFEIIKTNFVKGEKGKNSLHKLSQSRRQSTRPLTLTPPPVVRRDSIPDFARAREHELDRERGGARSKRQVPRLPGDVSLARRVHQAHWR